MDTNFVSLLKTSTIQRLYNNNNINNKNTTTNFFYSIAYVLSDMLNLQKLLSEVERAMVIRGVMSQLDLR